MVELEVEVHVQDYIQAPTKVKSERTALRAPFEEEDIIIGRL